MSVLIDNLMLLNLCACLTKLVAQVTVTYQDVHYVRNNEQHFNLFKYEFNLRDRDCYKYGSSA